MKDGKLMRMLSFHLSDINKVEGMSYLALLKNASVVLNPESFSQYEIQKNQESINALENHISQTWPDYKVMYESWKTIAQKAGDDFYIAKQEVYKLQQELETLKIELNKAQKKIVYLKKNKV